MVAVTRKLRILCLHGYTQNAITFSKKTAVLRKALKDVAELGNASSCLIESVSRFHSPYVLLPVYVTGPHKVLEPEFLTVEERQAAAEQEVSEGIVNPTKGYDSGDIRMFNLVCLVQN
jgi:hypothetical protein